MLMLSIAFLFKANPRPQKLLRLQVPEDQCIALPLANSTKQAESWMSWSIGVPNFQLSLWLKKSQCYFECSYNSRPPVNSQLERHTDKGSLAYMN